MDKNDIIKIKGVSLSPLGLIGFLSYWAMVGVWGRACGAWHFKNCAVPKTTILNFPVVYRDKTSFCHITVLCNVQSSGITSDHISLWPPPPPRTKTSPESRGLHGQWSRHRFLILIAPLTPERKIRHISSHNNLCQSPQLCLCSSKLRFEIND